MANFKPKGHRGFQVVGTLFEPPQLNESNNGGMKYTEFIIEVVEYNSQKKEETITYIPITAFAYTAEQLCKYHKQGDFITVIGNINAKQRQSQDGRTYDVVSLVANKVLCGNSHQMQQEQNTGRRQYNG